VRNVARTVTHRNRVSVVNRTDRSARPGTTYRRGGVTALTAELATIEDEQAHTPRSADLLVETGASSRITPIEALGATLTGHGSSAPVMDVVTGFEPLDLLGESS